jgi:outer membrane protein OmpA-like peptidoglycan-associated protein
MKKIVLLLGLLTTYSIIEAQLLKKIKDKVDKTVEKKVDDATSGKKDEKGNGETSNNTGGGSSAGPATMKTYSKYDFVPGEVIIVYEDFMQDAVGDFPAKWNTNAGGEVMTVEGKQGHWFAMNKVGYFMPDFIDSLPDNFTLEFDIMVDQIVHSWGIHTSLVELQDRNKPETWGSANNRFTLNMLPGTSGNGSSQYDRRKDGTGEAATSTRISQFDDLRRPVHVAFWRQKERLRVYLNEEKVWDVPKAILPTAKLNSLVFAIQGVDKWRFLITNIRLGVGAPDTRKKILEQKKWVTHGILFDVNSATIKPESYGTLKEMADVMKEYADLKVKIVGHTDADGSDDTNLELSKKRAASVKQSLAKEFGIDESRMETDGKGESEPMDKNDTPAGKANNRRVEFIKL